METIELVSWKQIVKRYGYKQKEYDGKKGTRFGIKLELDGMHDTQFIWCETNLERKKLFKTIINIAKKEGRELNIIN
tara:strand:- start:879 stop:1109 length:231 start_codon:yes stop_codon:yes gene_type:complete